MASVSKRPWKGVDGTEKFAWIVRWQDADGVRRGKTFQQKKAADAYKRQVEREIDDGTHVSKAASLSVALVGDEYLKAMASKVDRGEIGKPRLTRVRQMLDHFNKKIGSQIFKDLSPKDIDDLYDYLTRDVGIVPYSARMMLSNLKTIERFALRRGYIKSTPVAHAMMGIKPTVGPKVQTFTVEQVQLLLGLVLKRPYNGGQRNWAMMACFVHLAACCGMRAGEIRALRWSCIDFDQGEIAITASLTEQGVFKGPKTAAGVRDVTLPNHLAEMLVRYRSAFARDSDNGFVFTRRDGRNVGRNSIDFMWRDLLDRAGLLDKSDAYHFHALRHFAASWWIENGMKIADVTRQIGHSSSSTTLQVYTHSLTKRDARHEEMQRMSAALVMLPDASATQATI